MRHLQQGGGSSRSDFSVILKLRESSLPALITSAHRGLDEPHEGDPVLGLGAGRGAVRGVVVRPGEQGSIVRGITTKRLQNLQNDWNFHLIFIGRKYSCWHDDEEEHTE